MTESRTLQPGDEISHYRIVGPLGAGGMGEVYRAQDLNLERNVALKVLPAALVKNPERVRRFVLEAKSASSLNHPNIVTIYEIGQDSIRAGGGTPRGPSGPDAVDSVHFISMELVAGKTLGELIHEEKADLKTLLGYLAQAAEGISKAHAAGIVHRDLKPGNIMVTPDGFAKVLDFGLAKLTERRPADAELSSMATMSPEATGEGVVLGTAGYMSPEQVQGKPIDHRSDVFSFGCLLYEATTGQRPFAAESGLETMHKIVNEKPGQIEDLNPKAPAELRRVIRRCLAKNPEQRLQSMKDLALELREIVDEFETLSVSGTSGSLASGAAQAAGAGGRRLSTPVVVAVAVVVGVVGLLAGVWGWQRSTREEPGSAFASMRASTLTNVGDASDGVLSPDGRYLAYASGPGSERKLWVRQVATGSDVEVLRLEEVRASGLVFSPDGDYLYYLALDPTRSGYRALYQIPSLGGVPQRRAFDVDSPISFEPDGRRGCFMRGVPSEQAAHIVLVEVASGKEQVLTKVRSPRAVAAGPVWSPAGDRIAIAETKPEAGLHAQIVIFDVESGRRDSLETVSWPIIESIAWHADGGGLLVAGLDLSATPVRQVFSVDLPKGRIHRLTNDFNEYWGISLSADGQSISAMRSMRTANVWAVPADGATPPHQITFTSDTETAIGGLAVLADGDLAYTAPQEQYYRLFAMSPAGGAPRTLTPGVSYVPYFFASTKGVALHMVHGEEMIPHVWHIDLPSGEMRQLTEGGGEQLRDLSRDGETVLFARANAPSELWVLPVRGGEPRRIFDNAQGLGYLSPDGSQVLVTAMAMVDGMQAFQEVVVPVSGGEPKRLDNVPPQILNEAWHPDASGFTYLHLGDSRNVYFTPLAGGPPRPLTRFEEGRARNYRWSPDGRRMLVYRQIGRSENLWIVDANGANARSITAFQTGEIFDFDWSPDGRTVYFVYGEARRDVVLLRSAAS